MKNTVSWTVRALGACRAMVELPAHWCSVEERGPIEDVTSFLIGAGIAKFQARIKQRTDLTGVA